MINIREAITKKELKQFILFSFNLYKDNPNWIPPLIQDELITFDKTQNPVFENAEAYFYCAYKDGKMVGKVAAIVNWSEVKDLGKKKVRFGWFDVIDDIEVTKALLEKVYELGRKHNLEEVEGPMGFSNMDKVGLLTEGFEHIGTMITWYNYPYYVTHFEQLGYVKEKQFLESVFPFANVKLEVFERTSDFICKRYQLRVVNCKSTKEVLKYADQMFDLFNECYAKLSSFVPISAAQKEFFKKKYMGMINPEFINFVFDANDKMIAFSIIMPSLTEALKKANGRLFPFGWYHLWRAKTKTNAILFYLIGIHPDYQNKGVTAPMFIEYFNAFKRFGIETCIRTPELDENNAIHNLWKTFDPVIHKRRCTYMKKLE